MSTFFKQSTNLSGDLPVQTHSETRKRHPILSNKIHSNQADIQVSTDKYAAIAKKAHSTNSGRMVYDGCGTDATECGDTITFYINLHNDMVKEITCRVRGCSNTFISAKAAAMLVKEKSLKEAFKLATAENIDAIAQLPAPNRHCADLAASALTRALRNAVTSRREPWRKLYRRN